MVAIAQQSHVVVLSRFHYSLVFISQSLRKMGFIHDVMTLAVLVTTLPIYRNTHAIDGTVGPTNQISMQLD